MRSCIQHKIVCIRILAIGNIILGEAELHNSHSLELVMVAKLQYLRS